MMPVVLVSPERWHLACRLERQGCFVSAGRVQARKANNMGAVQTLKALKNDLGGAE